MQYTITVRQNLQFKYVALFWTAYTTNENTETQYYVVYNIVTYTGW